jgi:hypothetical protein
MQEKRQQGTTRPGLGASYAPGYLAAVISACSQKQACQKIMSRNHATYLRRVRKNAGLCPI